MNLPIRENAIVFKSTATEFSAWHKDNRNAVMNKYVSALKAQDWTLDKLDDKSVPNRYNADLSKGAEKLLIDIGDDYQNSENSRVFITKSK